MSPDLVGSVVKDGVFAVLFVALLIYVLQQNERRETRLLKALDQLSICYEAVKKDVAAIRKHLAIRKEED